jgi:HEAT repeat protein
MAQSDNTANDDFITRLQKSLSFTNTDSVRMRCLEQLTEMQEIPAAHLLIGLLLRTLREDPNAVVRHEAAFVLGRLPQSQVQSDLVGDEIFSALCHSARTDPSIVVRHEATEVLGNLEDSRVPIVLQELAEDDNPDVALTAKLGLEHQAHDQRATNQLRMEA